MSAAPRPASTINTTIANTAANASSKAPPPPLTIAPGAIVADKASITGTHRITIARNAIIHPFARLDSSTTELEIGESTTVWEKSVIGAASSAALGSTAADDQTPPQKTSIGPYATISAHATIEATAQIGAHTNIEVGARVGAGCAVGSHCRLSPMTELTPGSTESIEDFTVLFFADGIQQTRINVSARDSSRARELETKAREREREVVGKVVKGAAAGGKWR